MQNRLKIFKIYRQVYCIDCTKIIIIYNNNVYTTNYNKYLNDGTRLGFRCFIRSDKGNINIQDTSYQSPLRAPFSLSSLTLVIIALMVLINTFRCERFILLIHEKTVSDRAVQLIMYSMHYLYGAFILFFSFI